MQVRAANIDDLDVLVEFTTRQVRESEGAIKAAGTIRDGIGQALADSSLSLYWILEVDGAVVGSASALRTWSDWNAGYYWWLQSMYLEPEHRGQGGMRKLVDAIKTAMVAESGLELRIYLNKDNEAAIAAYTAAGFQKSVYEIMVWVDDAT